MTTGLVLWLLLIAILVRWYRSAREEFLRSSGFDDRVSRQPGAILKRSRAEAAALKNVAPDPAAELARATAVRRFRLLAPLALAALVIATVVGGLIDGRTPQVDWPLLRDAAWLLVPPIAVACVALLYLLMYRR